MRVFSYLFHGVLALFLLAISSAAILSGMHTLQMEMLPWEGKSLTYWLLFLALFALAALVLALKGTARVLFFLWSLAVVVLLVRGYFFGSYTFDGADEFKQVLWLTMASLVALLGAWFQMRHNPYRR